MVLPSNLKVTFIRLSNFSMLKPGKGAAFVTNKVKKYHQWWCCRKDIPSDREVPYSSH